MFYLRGKTSKLDNPNFSFQYTFFYQTLKELEKLDPKVTSRVNDTPVQVIKENKDAVAFFIHHNFSNSLSSSTFPTTLKYADIKTVFKKDDKTDKENYRPISILPTLTWCMKDLYTTKCINQMYPYFQKGFNAQNCLTTMIEKWQRSVDRGDLAGALLTDLSKAFDCIDLELLIAKLYVYGFDKNSFYFYSFVFERPVTRYQNKFRLRRVCWDSFYCTSGFYIVTISF